MFEKVLWRPSKAFCKFCWNSLSISGSGEAQVKSHARSKYHNDNTPSDNQSTFAVESGKSQLSISTKIMFNSEERVIREEVLEALQVINSNSSFASSGNDNERFKVMFPDYKYAQSGKTKVKY